MFNTVLAKEEREVHFWLDDTDRIWKAESSIGKWTTKLKAAGWTVTNTIKDENGRDAIVRFEAPEHAISIRKATKRPKKELTDEQKAAFRARISMAKPASLKTQQ